MKYSEHTHEHTELVRRLEESRFIFSQHPKVITEVVKAEDLTPAEKIIVRAQKIDADGKIALALERAKLYIKGSQRIIHIGYFVLGFVGVFGLLSMPVVNFFYVMMALLGWHSISLLWWLFRLMSARQLSFFGSMFEHLTFEQPLMYRFIGTKDDPALQHALQLQLDIHQPVKRWYIGKILHGAWLCSLIGATLALLCLFLFRRYDFAWESTLLTDTHFEQMMAIFGTLPNLLGFSLPSVAMPIAEQNARFAWLIMLSIALYGILPRLLVYLVCIIKARVAFAIDTNQAYYARLLREFSQSIISQDDYRPTAPSPAPSIDTTGKSFVAVAFERPYAIDVASTPVNICHEFGMVDDKDSIERAIHTAKQANALIYLMIDVHILPDRGVMRKISTLTEAGLVAKMVNIDEASNNHLSAWQQKLDELGVAIIA